MNILNKLFLVVILILHISCVLGINYDNYRINYFPFNNSWSDYWGGKNLTLESGGNGANVTNGYLEWDTQHMYYTGMGAYLQGTNLSWYVQVLGSKRALTHDDSQGNIQLNAGAIDTGTIDFFYLYSNTANNIACRLYTPACGWRGAEYYLNHTYFSQSDYNVTCIYNSTGFKMYHNAVLVNQSNFATKCYITSVGKNQFNIGRHYWNNGASSRRTTNGALGIFKSWNTTLDESAIQNLQACGKTLCDIQLFGFNCTSCNIPNGDITEPYTTYDTTPTFKFETNVDAWCRISDENENYTSMGSYRNCSGGEGGNNHTCSLTTQDELISSTDYVYIICNNPSYPESNVAELQMEITNLDTNTTLAIQRGIENSVIWPNATIFSNKNVYLMSMNNTQIYGVVDKVAVYGNQRWLLHYTNETEILLGLFNLTPYVYSLEMRNMSIHEIEPYVTAFINSTKI